MIPQAKTSNQLQSYFHRTFRATITAEQLLNDIKELGQWQYVAKKHNVSHAYIIMARKFLGIFEKTVTRGKQYGGLNSRQTINGGKRIDKRGYILVGRYHPDNTKEMSAYEHTLIMEKHIGRKLNPGEGVHHIDNNKSNNDINNLFLINHSTHRKCDLSAQDVTYELYKKGLVIFDRDDGIYKINEEYFKHKKK